MDDSDAKNSKIILSPDSEALIGAVESREDDNKGVGGAKINVSQTVSFFAIVYEKIRNSIEFQEENVIRRAAIERILKRRLSLNPDGIGEGENIIRELLWARYLPPDYVTQIHVKKVQKIVSNYILLSKKIKQEKTSTVETAQFIIDFLSCEIEEALDEKLASKKAAYLYFFFQVLHKKVRIEGIEDDIKDSYFYAACESAYQKNDRAYIRFHLFTLQFTPIQEMDEDEITSLAKKWINIEKKIEEIVKNPYKDKMFQFAKKQVAPFLILYEIIELNKSNLKKTLTNASTLLEKTTAICDEKYKLTSEKLATSAIRSIIYIFLTKMIFVLMLEFPLTKAIYGEIHYPPLVINSLFPPLLMGFIVSFIRVPSTNNTNRIYNRIIDILNKDTSFEDTPVFISTRKKIRRPILFLGFTILYAVAFGVTFAAIYSVLEYLHFNAVSKSIFMFFVSVVAFFGYRIRQTAKEYSLDEKDGFFSPLIYFFFLPILSVGKFLSGEIAKLNVLMVVFDFFIEAPFKIIFDIVEEWVRFVRSRKDDII